MPSLSRDNRKLLENNVVAARPIAEKGAEKALISLGIGQREAPDSLTQQERILRNQLRAHGRQLGDGRYPNGAQETRHLTQAVAYEQWHRMLFARFLAENDLLMHPDYGIAMSMNEVQEAAREQGVDWLTLATNCAQHMLIEVFRADDPVLHVVLPPETRLELEQKLGQLPAEVFTADDSLGWVYQFWQSDEKERVNKSEVKIGADELAPVTQLFTEDYMVLFLLHNTLGAWWTAKRRAEGKGNELQDHEWTYLRLNEDGSPAAGSFDSWPSQLSELRILDPCMGSGHFLAFALPILTKMAETEYALTPGEAVHSVLIQNLYGLELDARCSQIAAFNLALTAWRIIGRYVPLPPMNLACSGLGINAPKESWVALAGNNGMLRDTLAELYMMFQKAPILGSLIDPTRVGHALLFAQFEEVWPFLEKALAAEGKDDETRELAVAARGVLAAARLLGRKFSLVATNVPYLGRRKQAAELANHLAEFYPEGAADLATCFIDRCTRLCSQGGTCALVTPQSWLFLTSYTSFRSQLLTAATWGMVVRLGPRAFETVSGEVVHAALLILSQRSCPSQSAFAGIDVSAMRTPSEKAVGLTVAGIARAFQRAQLANPDVRIVFSTLGGHPLLGTVAKTSHGQTTFDSPRFNAAFWEIDKISNGWVPQQSTPAATMLYGGCHYVLRWEDGRGGLAELMKLKEQEGYSSGVWRAGVADWGRRGVIVGQMHGLPCSLYMGCAFDDNASVIIPTDEADLPAIWSFCSSPDFNRLVRQVDSSVKVTSRTLVKVPCDLAHWRRRAGDEFGDALPTPNSSDSSQWLFSGHPLDSDLPLQVAVARLVGYRWPRQTGTDLLDCLAVGPDGLERHADLDGIVCLPSLGGVEPAAQRLRSLLQDSFGAEWSASRLQELLGNDFTLEQWLRDKFFEEHCAVFQNRPFVWHIWDGRKDGFHALVNYHRLAAPNGGGRRTIEKLIYSSLGDWIGRQRAEVASNADGSEGRLSAALHLQTELEKILVGEPPYDIFVRWKPLYQQPIGWEPDIDDGVRLNIRPWLTAKPYQAAKRDASILRTTPIKLPLGKDRGKEPARDRKDFPWFADSEERTNDVHLTLDEKQKAREQKKP